MPEGELGDGLRGADGEQVAVGLAVAHDEGLLLQLVDVHSRGVALIAVLQVAIDLGQGRAGGEHQQEQCRDHFDYVLNAE